MSNKTFMAAIVLSIILISLVVGTQVIRDAKANPFMLYHHMDPIPETIPPSIIIFGPQNNTVLNSNFVYFSFNASKPQPPVPMEVGIIIITYSQDNSEPTDLYSIYNRNMTFGNGVPPGLEEFNFFNNLTLPQGNHQISIHTYSVALSDNLGMFGMDSYATVFFTINTSPLKITDLSMENKVYNTKDVLLSYNLNEPVWWQAYSLDNQANATIRGNTTLTGLRDGEHSIVVYANDFAGNTGLSILAHFVVDATPPNISNLSVENKTYNTTSIPLNFTLSEPSIVGYCLDGKANVTIAGNITLTGLGEGSHSLVLYANDTIGNRGKSDAVFFTINTQPSPTPSPTQQPTLEPSPTPTVDPYVGWIPYAIISIIAAIVGVTVYAVRKLKK